MASVENPGISSRVADITSLARSASVALRMAAKVVLLAGAILLAEAGMLLALDTAGSDIEADLSTGRVGGIVPGICSGWGASGRCGAADEASAAGAVRYSKAQATPASVLENNFTIWGDSTAAGGGVMTGGEKWATILKDSYTPPRSNFNGAGPGSTTATQRSKFASQPLYRNRIFIHMDWPNAGETVQGWTDNVQAMIDLLGHNHYLVVAAIRKTDGTEDPGTTRGDFMTSLNNAIAAKWPNNFVDYNAALASPSTRKDSLHRNAAGHRIEYQQIRAWLDAKGW